MECGLYIGRNIFQIQLIQSILNGSFDPFKFNCMSWGENACNEKVDGIKSGMA